MKPEIEFGLVPFEVEACNGLPSLSDSKPVLKHTQQRLGGQELQDEIGGKQVSVCLILVIGICHWYHLINKLFLYSVIYVIICPLLILFTVN